MLLVKSNIQDTYIIDSLTSSTLTACKVVYSLKLLTISYKGPLIRVRKSSTNELKDFYADSYGNLGDQYLAKGISLDKWLGSDIGYVNVWYNQIDTSLSLIHI
jgi:hypothetical protein